MSSPNKRTALSIKSTNISPAKRLKPFQSPLKQVTHNTSFQIFQDSTDYRSTHRMGQLSLGENEQLDKENIAPSKVSVSRRHRRPLQELSIDEFPGFVTTRNHTRERLTLPLGGQIQIPSYITPPRSSVRDFFSSTIKKNTRGGAATTDNIPKHRVVRKLSFDILKDL